MAIMREPHGFWRPPVQRRWWLSIADVPLRGKHRVAAEWLD